MAFVEENAILSAGAADGMLKLWDVRNISSGALLGSNPRGSSDGRTYGISALDVDPAGRRILASATDSRIYVYDSNTLNIGPTHVLSGHQSTSFYVKATFDSTGDMVLSGSEDSKAYIWNLRRRKHSELAVTPHWLTLEGHQGGEVSDVAWCRSDPGLIATVCDDTTMKV